MQLNVRAQVQKASIRVSSVNPLPESVPSPPSEPIKLLNISISGASDSEIESATLHLSVNKSRVSNPAQLVVYRFHGGSWQTLETNSSIVGNKIRLSAKTPGFSYFAIGTESSDQAVGSESAKVVDSRDSAVTKSADGVFTKLLPKLMPTGGWIVLGVAFLSSVEVLRRRRSRDSTRIRLRSIISKLIVRQDFLDKIFYTSASLLIAESVFGLIGFYADISIRESLLIGGMLVFLVSSLGLVSAGLLTSLNRILSYIERRLSAEEQSELTDDPQFHCRDCGHSWKQSLGEDDEVVSSEEHLEIQWSGFSNTTVRCLNCSATTSVERTDSTSWR
ncbi:uncharacterized protein OE_6301F (plasmid) [Halobacterium salinarum R1]|uniref:PGF-pre-PGF domain-containing protein n=2 Tax=Halobacterium salinarum TaxID=2242 RepID=B0R989_HALS3|nr:uncharacterized protein OE_6301F [Halobacterium salinarum R1]